MRLTIPELSVVLVIGTTGSGKSTFCRRHFLPTEVLSSDAYRGYVCDDENSQDANVHAFEALHFMLGKRLQLGRLTVIDATNVQKEARASLLQVASRWHALRVAIVLDVPESVCAERNEKRSDRAFGPHVIRTQHADLRRTLGQLKAEKYHRVYVLKPDDIEKVEIVREPAWSNRHQEHGPFDIIGDVHGCWAELQDLLQALGWQLDPLRHPEDRKLVFVGDLVDRGPQPAEVLRFVMSAVQADKAICVPGNHDIRLARALRGDKVSPSHGLKETLEQLSGESDDFRSEVAEFLRGLVSHAMLDDGKLCVAHAGLVEEMQGRGSPAVREFCLYGETTGEIDEFGLPVRYQWANDYRGKAMVVYGHTPVPEPVWINHTIDIDTGCVFGGKLTALRYPERDLVSVPARATYWEPVRPLVPAATEANNGDLDLQDVLKRMNLETRLAGRLNIREENAVAALEVMSRFAADPRWLIYLPPTMAPCETSLREGYLEYPTQAFDYYRRAGVPQVVCEEKHMGSRAMAIVCRHPGVSKARFGIEEEALGTITTRTGRRFFGDVGPLAQTETRLLGRIADAAERAGVWEELESDWMLLDLELMPWSVKAVSLLRDQYAPVGAAAEASALVWKEVASGAAERGLEGAEELLEASRKRQTSAERFRDAYRRYCWAVESDDDYKLAPFHLLASEGGVHVEREHRWHLDIIDRLCAQDPGILKSTPRRFVDLSNPDEEASATAWWEDLVAKGGEGMVVKPASFLHRRKGGDIVQPALKCRGPEYLRIIYGPEYLEDQNLELLRKRHLGRKRGLALREFALSVEAMERFVRREPLRRVHECVFAILALESEPVDPRL